MRDPMKAFLDFRRHIDEMFEELIYRPWALPVRRSWQPALDFQETPDAFLIDVDLPGVAPEQVRILAGERRLIIVGERVVPPAAGVLHNRCERPSGAFERSLDLPAAIDPHQARVEAAHGAYRIHLPKKRASQPNESATQVTETCHLLQVTVQ